MRFQPMGILILAVASLATACADTASSRPRGGGSAQVDLEGTRYDVRDVTIEIETGENSWFHIDGTPVDQPHADCVPGLEGGIGLYGDLPAGVRSLGDLAGKRLQVDFTGDGDEANFCFAGMGGLAGAEEAWITFDAASDDRVAFSMTGTFRIYDENGDGPVKGARATGTAFLAKN